jgi:multiple sugar transport system permease protein
MNGVKKKFDWGKTLVLAGIGIYTAFVLFPIYWALNSSFKDVNDVYTIPPEFLPLKPTASAYKWLLTSTARGAFLDSLIISSIATGLAVFLGLLASYAFSRYPNRKLTSEGSFFNLLVVRMFPPIAFLLPIYWMWKYLGLIDTHFALIITYVAFNLPLTVWILRNFVDEVPRSLEEASYLDGYSFWQTMRRTMLPLISAGLAATIALCWIFIWNEFLIGYLLSGKSVITYPAYLPSLRRGMRIMWNQIAAISMLAAIPSILILFFFRKYIIRLYFK